MTVVLVYIRRRCLQKRFERNRLINKHPHNVSDDPERPLADA